MVEVLESHFDSYDRKEIFYSCNFKALKSTLEYSALTSAKFLAIGNRKDDVCLQFHGQVSRQPRRCHSAMLDPKGRSFRCVSGSLYLIMYICS